MNITQHRSPRGRRRRGRARARRLRLRTAAPAALSASGERIDCVTRLDQGLGLLAPRRTPWPSGSTRYQTDVHRRDHRLPGQRLRRRHPGLHQQADRVRRLRLRAQGRGQDRRPTRAAPPARPSTSRWSAARSSRRTTSPASTSSILTPGRARRHLRQHDHQVERPDDRRASTPASPCRTPRSPQFHRSDSSGTTDNFTKYLAAAAAAWTFGNAKEWKAPGGQGAKGSDGVASAVKSTAELHRLRRALVRPGRQASTAAWVDNGGGRGRADLGRTPPRPSPTATITGTGQRPRPLDRLQDHQAGYPIVLVTYEITCEKGLDAPTWSTLTKSFLTYTASDDGQAKLSRPRLRPDHRRPAHQGPHRGLVDLLAAPA